MKPIPLLLSILILAAAVYLAVLAGMYVFQRRLLYHPDRQAPSVPAAMQEVWFTTADGVRLNGWFKKPDGQTLTLLFLHGNAGNLDMIADKISAYGNAGFGVLAFDWRGYGKSDGEPSEEGLYADGRAALAFLSREGVETDRVALHGESLGSGVATKLASETSVAGVVLEAPFISVAEAAQVHYPYLPAKWLVKDRFDSLSRIANVQAPILILHGEADRTVPVEHGRMLLKAAGGRAQGLFYPGAGHMGCFDLGGREAAIGFLRDLPPR